jgi:hypothetical protein
MPECNDQVSMEWFILIVLYEDLLYFSMKLHLVVAKSSNDVFIVSFSHCL